MSIFLQLRKPNFATSQMELGGYHLPFCLDIMTQKTSLILRPSTPSTFWKTYSCNTAKNQLTFNFSGKMFLVGVRGNICNALFLDAPELHFRSTGRANICIFLHISVRKFLFDVGSFYLLGGWIIFVRRLAIRAS